VLPLKISPELGENIPLARERLHTWLSYTKATILDFCGFGSEEVRTSESSPDFFAQPSILLTRVKSVMAIHERPTLDESWKKPFGKSSKNCFRS
jgi:hypothetical protein